MLIKTIFTLLLVTTISTLTMAQSSLFIDAFIPGREFGQNQQMREQYDFMSRLQGVRHMLPPHVHQRLEDSISNRRHRAQVLEAALRRAERLTPQDPLFAGEVAEERPVVEDKLTTRPLLIETAPSRPIILDVPLSRPVVEEFVSPKHLVRDETPTRHVVEENTSPRHLVQDKTPTKHVVEENISPIHLVQDKTPTRHVVEENISPRHLVQDKTSTNHVVEENTSPKHVEIAPRIATAGLPPVKEQEVKDDTNTVRPRTVLPNGQLLTSEEELEVDRLLNPEITADEQKPVQINTDPIVEPSSPTPETIPILIVTIDEKKPKRIVPVPLPPIEDKPVDKAPVETPAEGPSGEETSNEPSVNDVPTVDESNLKDPK